MKSKRLQRDSLMLESPDSKRIAQLRSGFALDTTSESNELPTVNEKFKTYRNPLTSLLASLLVHTALLLALLLLVYRLPQPIPRISVLSKIESADPLVENPADVEMNTIEIELPDDTQSPVEMTQNDISLDNETQIAQSENALSNAIAKNDTPNVSVTETPAQPKSTLPTGGGLAGRDITARGKLAASRGGSRNSEMAVEQGLRWILAHQRDDGSWRFHHDDGNCQGACTHEGEHESTSAATGLALLALLGAGYTHQAGPHQEAVQKGLDHLLKEARYTAHGAILARQEDRMYSQAIATMALSEALAMTGDTSLVTAVFEAKKYNVAAQHRRGSWGYIAGSSGDTTMTGWHIMALKSCQLAGLKTERQVWQNAEKFIDSMASSDSSFGYKSQGVGTPATTAIGLLSKMYLGMPKEHRTLNDGSEILIALGPSKTDVYFNYYATMVLHHRQGSDWREWNTKMREYLIASQAKGQGHADGSWYFDDQHGKIGGRLYTTAMAVMILEVYYRYLPLYEDDAIEPPANRS